PVGAATLSGLPGSSAAWLARSVRDAEAAGSNPAFPTRGRLHCGLSVVGSDGPVVVQVPLFDVGELGVGTGFDMHEVIVGSGQCADQLVELQLGGRLFTALSVL